MENLLCIAHKIEKSLLSLPMLQKKNPSAHLMREAEPIQKSSQDGSLFYFSASVYGWFFRNSSIIRFLMPA